LKPADWRVGPTLPIKVHAGRAGERTTRYALPGGRGNALRATVYALPAGRGTALRPTRYRAGGRHWHGSSERGRMRAGEHDDRCPFRNGGNPRRRTCL